jgi:hypothetical protein
MIRNVESRLLKLEAASSPLVHPWRRVIGDSEAECQAKRRAMIESGQAAEADDFVFRVIVSVPERTVPAISLALDL